jgi:hypothetical protein
MYLKGETTPRLYDNGTKRNLKITSRSDPYEENWGKVGDAPTAVPSWGENLEKFDDYKKNRLREQKHRKGGNGV